MARLGFFPNSYAAARTHVSRVAPDWDVMGTRLDLNPWPRHHKTSALLLCYNHCPFEIHHGKYLSSNFRPTDCRQQNLKNFDVKFINLCSQTSKSKLMSPHYSVQMRPTLPYPNLTFNVYFLTFKNYKYTFVKKPFDVWHFHWYTVPDQYSYNKGSREPSIESDWSFPGPS